MMAISELTHAALRFLSMGKRPCIMTKYIDLLGNRAALLCFPKFRSYADRRKVIERAKGTMTATKKLQIGDHLPNITLYEDSPENAIVASELYKGKKGVLFAVVGAFTPGCTNSHIPDYLSLHDRFKEEGYMISCVSVNDPFVMKAWGDSTGAAGKIRMLADSKGEFTKALGMELDCKSLLGGIRSHKYSLVINDGIVQSINVDPEHTGLACLLCIKRMSSGEKLRKRR